MTAPGRAARALLAALALAACEPVAADRPAEPPRPHPAADATPDTTTDGTAAAAADAASDPAAEAAPDAVPAAAADDASPPVFTRPQHVRGLYLTAWIAGSSRRVDELLEIARETEINTFVIDLKDATGYLSHASEVPEADAIGALGERRIRDLGGLLRRLHDEGVYPIARIVVVKDPLLVAARPELAVQDSAGGAWVDSKGFVWLNPYDERVWAYHVALAREAAELGFPEIQWDYIRFPDASASDMARARFPGDSLGERPEAIRGFLAYARDELADLDVALTADVFGVTTTFRRDIGIGQLWERFIDRVDAALPMVYPSHYWAGSYGFEAPNWHPYEVVREALDDARERSSAVEGAGKVIPWLQDFTLGEPRYGAPEVRAQIQATYDAGVDEWILWNPSSRYTVGALEPEGGFAVEPLIRVAGTVAPVSRRTELLQAAERGAN